MPFAFTLVSKRENKLSVFSYCLALLCSKQECYSLSAGWDVAPSAVLLSSSTGLSLCLAKASKPLLVRSTIVATGIAV